MNNSISLATILWTVLGVLIFIGLVVLFTYLFKRKEIKHKLKKFDHNLWEINLNYRLDKQQKEINEKIIVRYQQILNVPYSFAKQYYDSLSNKNKNLLSVVLKKYDKHFDEYIATRDQDHGKEKFFFMKYYI